MAGSVKKVGGGGWTKEVVEGRWGQVEKAETNCRSVWRGVLTGNLRIIM